MAGRDEGGFARGNGLIAAAIVVAALIVSWGSNNSQPRYQLAASGNAVVRLDTDSGALLACDLQQCRQIEEPLRAKTWGPLSVVIGNSRKDQAALPPPKPPQAPQPPAPQKAP
jgi:hypothetical protein